MQMLYNSEAYAVLQFELTVPPANNAQTAQAVQTATSVPTDPRAPATATPSGEETSPAPALVRGGIEIIDKATRRETYLEGLLAERFREGAQALAASGVSSVEHYDAYIAGYAGLAQQPLHLH
jgi:hypothetical protein